MQRKLLLRHPGIEERDFWWRPSFVWSFFKAAPDPTRRGFRACGVALPRAYRRLAMGMDVGGESGGSLSNPNVVPLIDILLVLIIIFMVITPLTPKGLDTLGPQPSPNQQQNVELAIQTGVVQGLMNGKGKINNEAAPWEGPGPRHEQILKDRALPIGVVKGDRDGW